MFGQLNREVSDLLPLCLYFVNQIETARQIDHRTAQGLVHRHQSFTVAIDSLLVAERLDQRLAQRDRDVLN